MLREQTRDGRSDSARDGRSGSGCHRPASTRRHDGRIQRLSSALTRRKLPIAFVRHVVSSMLVHGHNPLVLDPAEDLGEDRSTIVATRTGYDVYAAICREARRLPLYQREQAEQTAYSLLTREFSL